MSLKKFFIFSPGDMAAMVILLAIGSGALCYAPVVGAAQKADAAKLIRAAHKAIATVVKTAQADKSLSPDKANTKPFWEAMRQANAALGKAETGLALKEKNFVKELAQVQASLQQANIALVMNDNTNKDLDGAMKTLGGIVSKLNEGYGMEQARKKQGGKLSNEERAQLKKLQAQQDELQKKLDQMEKKVAKNNKKLQKGIDEIRRNSRQVRDSGYSVGDFFAAMIAARIVSDLIWGWHWWWGPWGVWGPVYVDVWVDIWVDSVDLLDYDWDLVDAEIELDELDLGDLDAIDEAALDETEEFLDSGDFELQEGDLAELTDELPGGWDDVTEQTGKAVEDAYEDNFEASIYESSDGTHDFRETDLGGDDFGADFGTDDFGGDFNF